MNFRFKDNDEKERTLTQLFWIAHTLYHAENLTEFNRVCKAIERHNGEYGAYLKKCIDIINDTVQWNCDRFDIRWASEDLLKSKSKIRQEVGKALAWQVELYS